MKNLKKLMIVAIMSIVMQQTMIASDDSADDSDPSHQGWGRLGTATGNILTLHPGNSVNALATGNQSDTTLGWHQDKNKKVKANRSHTKHNNNKNKKNKKTKQQKNKKNKNNKQSKQKKSKAHQENAAQ